ncbi:hypothetical protein [Streptomyces sp. NPDC050548]
MLRTAPVLVLDEPTTAALADLVLDLSDATAVLTAPEQIAA